MNDGIFSLAFQGVRRKKRSSILIFFVLLLSFSFAITSLSLLGSMSKTNAEFRLNTYGEWYFGIPSGMRQDAEWLETQSWAEKVGISQCYGTVYGISGENGLGTIDDSFQAIGRLKLDDGSWPTKDNEIAMEADVLGELGFNYSLGQEITLNIAVPVENSSEELREKDVCFVEQTYILCGIIHEYTDLWVLNQNKEFQLLNSLVVTEDAGNQLLEEARLQLNEASAGRATQPEPNWTVMESVPQYFINTSEENIGLGRSKLQNYLMETRIEGFGDSSPCENRVAYSGSANADTTAMDKFYIYAIAAVTLLAVLCIYLMQLPAEIHSFTVLRSIGITRGQMARLLLTESLILCLPAILLGIPFGMVLTWLALTLSMYSGSVAVQVVIPFSVIIPILFLWIGMVLLSRLIVFLMTVRTPLTGQMQMQRGKSRRAKVTRSCLIVLLLSVFCGVTIFTSMEVRSPKKKMEAWAGYPPYVLYGKEPELANSVIPKSKADLMTQISGVREVVGFGEMKITVSFDGTEIRSFTNDFGEYPIYLYALKETQWEETFRFGDDREAFHNGDLVLMLLPDDRNENDIVPKGNIQIHGYGDDGSNGELISSDLPLLFTSDPTPVVFRFLSDDIPSQTLAGLNAYTVICSEAYLQKLLDSMEPGSRWDKYIAGEAFGYDRVHVFTDTNADDLSTDIVMADFCSRNSILFSNRRQEYMEKVQEYFQFLLLLCSSGICIALMSLLLCFSALSLETEQEKRYFGTMRVIGMSSKQMLMKIMGKAFLRSCISVLAGWSFYSGYRMMKQLMAGAGFMESLSYVRYDFPYFLMISFVCMLVPFILSLIAKRKLKKESRLS